MSDVIKLLPDNIANQIAAGEVVQRPASVVKELLENSVDAGSRTIKLIVKQGGKSLIQVVDDGCGMSETDARMSFERHATSKIRQMDDLYRINTLGFRGEALASIAAVAQVELRTKRAIDEAGVLVVTENSRIQKHEACSCANGTSIAVKHLFFNVPARKNFLKSNPRELQHIQEEFLRVALANPEIHFSFYNEEEEIYHLRSGNLRQRIAAIWGKKYGEALVPVEEQTDMLVIKGFIGKPELARKSRGEQFFFANNRFIRSPYLNHAVIAGYEGLIGEDSFPFYMIFLELDPSRIDINVHPTKTEIKFDDEKAIYLMLRTAVRKSLNQYHAAPSLNFEAETTIPIPQTERKETSRISTGFSVPARDNFSESPFFTRKQTASNGEWEELYKVLSQAAVPEQTETEQEEILPEIEERKPVMQLHNRYIVTSIKSGLMIIQQSLAHERILFEKYRAAAEAGQSYSQQLMFPEVLELSQADFSLVEEIREDLEKLGFGIEPFGKTAFLLNAIPADLRISQSLVTLEKTVDDFKNFDEVNLKSRNDRLAAALARNIAIKAGTTLSQDELSMLIDQLFACETPYYSPDGKPVMITISSDELDKKFKK
jgi:DNA mismatch repair protein MutL